jgi:succinylglutamate desuccinylase
LLGAEQAGLFGSGVLAETGAAHALLERRRGSLPRVMEVVSRHAITPEERFVMEPGFMNLARVRGRRLLARDRKGPIHAPKDGFVILPLYQGQGGEGFFWGREVSATRLRFAEALRTMKVDRFLDLLPGVRRNPERPTQIEVDDRVARLYPPDVFTTFGYRRQRRGPSSMTIERQPE